MRLRKIFVAAAVLGLTASVLGQSADTRSLKSYVAAISASPAQRALALERFLSAEPKSSLHRDAMAWLTWTQLQIGDAAAAARSGRELLAHDAADPLALAATLNAPRRQAADRAGDRAALEQSHAALLRLDQLRRPEGMSDRAYAEMKRAVAGLLDGAAGMAAQRLGDAASAQVYLRYALSVFPQDSRYMYGLGLADLDAKPRNSEEGYWYLARAVNLTRSGDVNEYAFRLYERDGGSADQWRQFLASTAAPTARYVAPAGQVQLASTEGPHGGTLQVPPLPPAPSERAADLNPLVIPPEERAARAGEPLSLGILLETSLATQRDRDHLIAALGDMLRGLGRDDEAFVLSFSNDLVFEQDLTGNPAALDRALHAVKPQSGAALLDAVGFAAGHLQRIARNPNRALVVISDGRNSAASAMSAFQAEGQIDASNVRIYCIGIAVGDAAARLRLEALSSHTGGRTEFISGAGQFRAAAQQLSQNLGLDFAH